MMDSLRMVSGLVWLPLPFRPSLLLFMGFATLVVHVCIHLIDRVSVTIEPVERRAAFAKTAICVGSMVWALDVSGLFLYQEAQAQDARLAPAMLALGLMLISARLTVPTLSRASSSRRHLLAASGMAWGILAGHMVLMSSVGTWTGRVHGKALVLAALLTTALACGIALHHRAVQRRGLQDRLGQVPWWSKALAGVVILPVHFLIVNAFPVEFSPARGQGSGLSVLLVLVLFGVAISVEQLFSLQRELKRQELLNRALSMVRSATPRRTEILELHLATIAERLEILLGPGSLQMHFQPICTLPSPGEGVRFEALLRVVDPELGPIPPETFFLACERAGVSAWADRIILERALECSRPWIPAGCKGISVNVGPDTLLAPGFEAWVAQLLDKEEWPWGWLQLEITEHVLIASTRALPEILDRLSLRGVNVVLDDFGSGFSSLTVLMDLPLHGIKCDKAFVRHLAFDDRRQTLLRHLLAMGRDLGLSVTVEGVETGSELALVSEMGASRIQGNVFSPPLSSREVPRWLASHRSQLEALVPALGA